MGFAEEKVYKYIMQNMLDFRCIRVNQLIRHLPCLSDADREEIAAYDDRRGNEQGVWELFIRLKCRRDWVRQFIEALRRNEQQDLADRVESEYNAHQVRPRNNAPGPAVNNSLPSNVSVCSPVQPLATNLDHQCAENNPHASSLPRQPVSLPGPGTPLPHQSNPSAAKSDALRSSAESFPDKVDYNYPIQEMEPLAKQKVTEDALTPWSEDPSPQPTGNVARADLRASQGSGHHGDGLATTAVKLSPRSPVGHQLAYEGAPRRGMEMAEPGMPVSEPSAQRQDWAGRQQHPVCVRGGYFGNVNHLNIGSNSKASVSGDPVQSGELAAAFSPEDFKNQPEEVNFSSFERSLLASSTNRAVHGDGQQGSERGNLTSSMVDVRDPFLPRTQLDAEQTCVQGQGDHGGERDGFPLHQIGDSAQSTCSYGKVGASKGRADSGPAVRKAPASQATSIVPRDLSEDATAHDFGELHLDTTHSTSSSEKLASGTSTGPSQGIPGQNPGSSINSRSGGQSGGCLGDDSGPANSRDPQSKVQIPASAANTPRPASTPGPRNLLPTGSPLPPSLTSINKVLEVSSAMPAEEFSDLSGFSSTAVIPPSSPGLPSDSSGAAFNSDLDELKRPIQESELPEKGTDSSSTSRPKENATRAPKPPSSVVTRTSPGIPGDTASTTAREAGWETQNALPGFPEGCQVLCSTGDEEVELSKPGVLTSTVDGGREEPAERWPDAQETNGQYSGRSDRFFFSGACSVGSNPLMISKSSTASSSTSRSQSNQPEENCYPSLSDHPPPAWAASNFSGGDEAAKTSGASLPPESSSTCDSTAVGTHEFHVVEYPSADLGEAASLRSGDSAYENPSPGSRGPSRYQKSSSNKSGSPWNSEAPPGDSPQNVNGPRRGRDGTSFPLRDYVLPAAIAAVTSVVAFLFYKHLRN